MRIMYTHLFAYVHPAETSCRLQRGFINAPFTKTCDTFISQPVIHRIRPVIYCHLFHYDSINRTQERNKFLSFANEIVAINVSGVFNYHARGSACVFIATVLLNFRVPSFINNWVKKSIRIKKFTKPPQLLYPKALLSSNSIILDSLFNIIFSIYFFKLICAT